MSYRTPAIIAWGDGRCDGPNWISVANRRPSFDRDAAGDAESVLSLADVSNVASFILITTWNRCVLSRFEPGLEHERTVPIVILDTYGGIA